MRVAIWLTGGVLILLLYGAIVMPMNEVFQGMNAGLLFKWLLDTPLIHTWWLWGSIFCLVLLALNTIFCSIDSLIKKRNLLALAPQIIHLGFLFILLAHFMSSIGAYKLSGPLNERIAVKLPNGTVFRISDMDARTDPDGYVTDWQAKIHFISGGQIVKTDTLAPNRPAFYKGWGFYLKDMRFDPVPIAAIEASREPGAVWALVGGILFTLGTVALLILKIRQE